MSIPQQATQAAPQIPQAPQAPQSNDDAIGSVARDFLSDLQGNDDPDQMQHKAPTEEAPPQSEPDADGIEQEAETPTQPEIPMVEVEIDGEKFMVPEKFKGRHMADKDYRQKTMEVAAARKQLEQITATATQIAQQAQQLAPYHAQLFQMDNRAQQLQAALQSQQLANDPVEYNRVQGELAILLHNRGQFASGLQGEVQRLTAQHQQVRVQQLAVEAPKLFAEFPDLAKPETQAKLTTYVTEAGLPQEAVDFLRFSAPGVKIAWKAHQYDVMVADQAKAKAKLNQQTKSLPAASQSSRVPDKGAQTRDLQKQWAKGGGKYTDPNFDALLKAKLRKP